MKRERRFLFLILLLGMAWPAWAQVVQVSRGNKTIEISLSESVKVDPEIAEIKIGVQNYGRSKEMAYDENVRVANQILQALLDAGVPRTSIETQAIKLERPSTYGLAETPKEQQFSASQSWIIRSPAGEAQKIVDIAVGAGANEVEDVEWSASDPTALEAQANAAAIAKARKVADATARQMGIKVGELLYVSNRVVRPYDLQGGGGGQVAAFGYAVAARVRTPLKLFPGKVERSATLTVVFALE